MLLVVDPAGALHLQVKALGEHRLPFGEQGVGAGRIALQQGAADLPFLGAGQGDQAFGGLLHPLALDDDLAVALAVAPAAGDHFGEIAVAPRVHRQQGHAAERTVLVGAGEPDVGTADRLHTGAHGGLVELHQRAHVALVGDRHRRHPCSGHGLDQRLDPHQTVDQGELGVQTQVDEGYGHGVPMQGAKTTRPGLYRACPQSYRLERIGGDAGAWSRITCVNPRCPAPVSPALPDTGWHRRSAVFPPCAGRCSRAPA
ncbi:hypothetical protein D3C76_669600 [compost metagenome]